jgi:hypothetical protein
LAARQLAPRVQREVAARQEVPRQVPPVSVLSVRSDLQGGPERPEVETGPPEAQPPAVPAGGSPSVLRGPTRQRADSTVGGPLGLQGAGDLPAAAGCWAWEPVLPGWPGVGTLPVPRPGAVRVGEAVP